MLTVEMDTALRKRVEAAAKRDRRKASQWARVQLEDACTASESMERSARDGQ